MNTFLSMPIKEKLFFLLVVVGLIPTIAVLSWGIVKAMQSSEYSNPAWNTTKTTTLNK